MMDFTVSLSALSDVSFSSMPTLTRHPCLEEILFICSLSLHFWLPPIFEERLLPDKDSGVGADRNWGCRGGAVLDVPALF